MWYPCEKGEKNIADNSKPVSLTLGVNLLKTIIKEKIDKRLEKFVLNESQCKFTDQRQIMFD